MNNHFTAEFFVGNRRRFRDAVAAAHGDMPIVLTANGLLQRGGDSTFTFHQDSNFWYLTGIGDPDVTLVMDGADEYLIVPNRSASREVFDGAIDTAELTAASGIKLVIDEKVGWEKLTRSSKVANKLATPAAAPSYIEVYGMYTNPSHSRLAKALRQSASDIKLIDVRRELAGLRIIKQPAELVALQQAIDITMDSLELLTEPTRFAGYNNEYEIEADLTREFRFRGAAGHSFAPIIAGGKRAVTLHNVANEAPLAPDTLVILDVGAEVSHYAADITRTRAFGKPSARHQAVFDAVLDVQAYALGLLNPGVLLKDYEQSVEDYMGKTLQQLKLIKSIDRDAIRKYFPHATSHFLGLDVHDVGDYEQPLAPGTVVTCEPGIYIPEEGIGVRIEDDVLISPTGNHVLSTRLPKTLG